jgi:hypothetical protein
MSFKECIQINENLSYEIYQKLPDIRIVIIQEKYLTTGNSLGDWKHAYDTCNLSKCYTGKKVESNYRETFEKNFINTTEGKDLIDWSIGILCVAGDVPNDLDKKIVNVDNSKHQLFGCITPLCFNFEGDLQELLIETCKLSDKALNLHITELFKSFY